MTLPVALIHSSYFCSAS